MFREWEGRTGCYELADVNYFIQDGSTNIAQGTIVNILLDKP